MWTAVRMPMPDSPAKPEKLAAAAVGRSGANAAGLHAVREKELSVSRQLSRAGVTGELT